MKLIKRVAILATAILSLLIISCESENITESTQQIEEVEKSSSKSSTTIPCTIASIDNVVVEVGNEKSFEVTHSGGTSTPITWSIVSGAMQIIGANNQNVVKVRFLSGFNQGTLRVVVNGCDLRYTMKIGDIPPPDPTCKLKPLPIYSDFGAPVPDGYITGNLGSNVICTTTINNELSVPYNPCASYKWTISNGGGIFPSVNTAIVTVSQPGTYRVVLETTTTTGVTRELFVLYARNCDQGGGFGF